MSGNYWIIEEVGGEIVFRFDWSRTKLSKKQADFFFSVAPKEIVMAGRGFGKDHIALLKKIYNGIQRYWERRMGLDPAGDRAGLVWHLGVMAGESGSYDDNINKLFTMLPRLPGKGVGGRPMFFYNRKEQYFELFGLNQFRVSLITLYGDGGQRGPGYDDALVTEAQDIDEDKFLSVVLPMCVRPGYRTSLTLVGTGLCNWFDDACDQAIEGAGFYGDYKFFGGTSFDNPKTDVLTASQILKEYDKNPGRFQRERLGLPNVHITPDEKPDCPFHPGLVEACLHHDRPVIPPQPLVVMDLIYGGKDELCRGVWNKDTGELCRVDFFTSEELGIKIDDPYPSLTKFFVETSQQFPGCTIAYDKQGQKGSTVQSTVPKHIRLIPMTRNRQQKNAMVEEVIERMSLIGSNGKSLGLKIPHPDNRWLDAQQKKAFAKLLRDLYAYKKVTVDPVTERGAARETVYFYTKGDGPKVRDDGPDMLSWATTQLRKMNRRAVDVKQMGRDLRAGMLR